MRAVIGVPAEALRVSKQHLRQALKGIADRLMIVSEPFAVAYGLDALLHTLIIDIGAGTTDFCVMNGHYPTDEDQRTLELAGDAVDFPALGPAARTSSQCPILDSHGARVERKVEFRWGSHDRGPW